MMELIYTSAERGLKPNSSGFCTVAATAGMSRPVSMKLESLSGYEFCYGLSDARAHLNPVNYMHTTLTVGAETFDVLSRIGFCGSDYSSRSNKIAHHILLRPSERAGGGPGAAIRELAGGQFKKEWHSPPGELPPLPQSVASPSVAPPARAVTWERMTGDAGWAGELVRAFRRDKKVPAFVIFTPGMDVLPLIEESLAILPREERWSVCFSTYYTGTLPPDSPCHWRCVAAGSKAASEMLRFPAATIIDLTKSLDEAELNEYTEAAREGRQVSPLVAATPALRAAARTSPVNVAAIVQKPAGVETIEPLVDISGLEFSPASSPNLSVGRTIHKWKLAALVLGILSLILLITNAVTLFVFTRTEIRQPTFAADANYDSSHKQLPSVAIAETRGNSGDSPGKPPTTRPGTTQSQPQSSPAIAAKPETPPAPPSPPQVTTSNSTIIPGPMKTDNGPGTPAAPPKAVQIQPPVDWEDAKDCPKVLTPVHNTSTGNQQTVTFDVPDATRFIHLPKVMKGDNCTEVRGDEPNVQIVEWSNSSGLGSEQLKCTLTKGTLTCQFPNKQRASPADWLAVCLANERHERYVCYLKSPSVTDISLPCGYDSDGGPLLGLKENIFEGLGFKNIDLQSMVTSPGGDANCRFVPEEPGSKAPAHLEWTMTSGVNMGDAHYGFEIDLNAAGILRGKAIMPDDRSLPHWKKQYQDASNWKPTPLPELNVKCWCDFLMPIYENFLAGTSGKFVHPTYDKASQSPEGKRLNDEQKKFLKGLYKATFTPDELQKQRNLCTIAYDRKNEARKRGEEIVKKTNTMWSKVAIAVIDYWGTPRVSIKPEFKGIEIK